MLESLVSGVGSAITGGIVGAVTGRKAAKRAYESQKKLNQQVFEQNQELARQQNEMNVQQWTRENEYNTPAAQMARLEAAGLNPDLVVQGLGGVAASSPSLTAGTPMEPFDSAGIEMQRGQMSYNGLMQGADLGLNSAVSVKQMEMMDKQLQMMDTAHDEQKFDLQYKKEMKETRQSIENGQLTLQGTTIDLKNAQKDWTNQDKERICREVVKINAEIDEINQRIDESRKRTELIEQDVLLKKVENRFADRYWQTHLALMGANIKKLYNEAEFVNIQNKHIGEWYVLRNLNLQQETNTSNALEGYWDASSKNLNIKSMFDLKWSDAERSSKVMLNKAQVLENVTGAAENFMESLFKPAKFLSPGGKGR